MDSVKVTVILGAGASHDSFNSNIRVSALEWWPPLAAHIFGSNQQSDDYYDHRGDSFLAILNKYAGAESVAAVVAPHYSQPDFDLENILSEVAANPSLSRHFLEVPPYLRDIFANVSRAFGSRPGNYFALASGLLSRVDHEVLFLTLNYDSLLERNLTYFSSRVYTFDHISSYVADRQAKVVKAHGREDWFAPLHSLNDQPAGDITWNGILDQHGLNLMDPQIFVKRNHIGATKSLTSADFEEMESGFSVPVYPVLTAPLAEKRDSDLVCPDEHTLFAEEFMRDCAKFLVIGTSGQRHRFIPVDRQIGPRNTDYSLR